MTTTHLIPAEIRVFGVTPEIIAGELPEWLRGKQIGPHRMGNFLVQPWRDEPDHIEVWTAEQLAARTGRCAYERAAEVVESRIFHSDYPSDPETLNLAAKAIRQLAKADAQ